MSKKREGVFCGAVRRIREGRRAVSEAESIIMMKGISVIGLVIGRRLLRPTQWSLRDRKSTSLAAW